MEQSNKEMLLNPLDSIKQDGILGFKLGDTEEEVFSRIKTLGLMNEREIKMGKQSVAVGIEKVEMGDLMVGGDMFSEISSIHLNINRYGLKTITVNIKRQISISLQQQFERLTVLLIGITGKVPKSGQSFWELANNSLSLYTITDKICLEFDKHVY